MESENNKRNIIVVIIAIVLIFVTIIVVTKAIEDKKEVSSTINLKINQIYSSDYDLTAISEDYFIGTYEKNKLSVVINNKGEEIYTGLGDIYYEDIYLMKDGRYLLYNNLDNKLNTYIFDGENIEKFYEIDNVSYVKPIIYKDLDKEYIIGFVSIIEESIYLYNLNSSGIIVVNDVSLVADYNDNGIYYTYNENYLVVKNKEGLMGVIDLNGQIIIDCKYKNIINTYNDSFIALNKKDNYGIIDKNDDVLVKFKYKAIDFFENYYLVVNNKNKMALYDLEYKNLTGFKMNYDSLIDYDLRNEFNSINLYRVDGKVVVINNYMEDKNGTEFDKHQLYIIDGKKIIKTIKQVGFGSKDVIYTYDKNYNVTIYDNQFEKMFKFKLDDIRKIEDISYANSEIIRVNYLDTKEEIKTVYFDLLGKKIEFNLGNLVIKSNDYYGYITESEDGKKLSFYDLNNNFLTMIDGKDIKIHDDFLIIDKSIYKIEVENN